MYRVVELRDALVGPVFAKLRENLPEYVRPEENKQHITVDYYNLVSQDGRAYSQRQDL